MEKIANEALIKIISIFHGLSAELYLLSEFFMDFSSEQGTEVYWEQKLVVVYLIFLT